MNGVNSQFYISSVAYERNITMDNRSNNNAKLKLELLEKTCSCNVIFTRNNSWTCLGLKPGQFIESQRLNEYE